MLSYVELEIASQPACWHAAAELARSAAARFPRPGERLAVIGCGTSLYIAQAYAALREATGHGETDVFPASEMPIGRTYDRILALSRSGTTTEVLDALGRSDSQPTLAITADPRSPIVNAVDEVIVLDFADERSIVQTRFATSALALLRAHLGQDLDSVITAARDTLVAPLPDGATECDQFTFLGHGWTVGLAMEAALKLKEAAGAWTEAYPAMEYRHGPISVAGPNSLVWMFGAYSSELVGDVRRTGAAAVVSSVDPLAELIRVQRLAVALAAKRGFDPDNPRHLTRSVILGTVDP